MSYLDYPRILFSGRFQASPSTINNTPNNYDPTIYPSPNELQEVELYWNPRGDGGFSLIDCVITGIEYAKGEVITDPKSDPLIGQPVAAVQNPSFPLQGAIVDLDPMQQNVSEIFGLQLVIGNKENNLSGQLNPVPFTGIWGQCQGPNAPHSSSSGSAVFQAKMQNVTVTADGNSSPFLEAYAKDSSGVLSLNINTNAHNNKPPTYDFTPVGFALMKKNGVPDPVLKKLEPMQRLFQNVDRTTKEPAHRGIVPTKVFVKFMLKQYLDTTEFNDNIDTILNTTKRNYTGSTSYDFTQGMITGSIGFAKPSDPSLFVASRMLCPAKNDLPYSGYYAPFQIDPDNIMTLNLGNSLPTETPGAAVYTQVIGELWVVSFPDGTIDANSAKLLYKIPIDDPDLITKRAGMLKFSVPTELQATPIGIINIAADQTKTVVLNEDPNGYYCRANRFVYRMNPGEPTTANYQRGKTNQIQIHALKFGVPVPDGTLLSMQLKTEAEALAYTNSTPGTSGTQGLKNLSIPQDKLTYQTQAATVDGVATFDISCSAPGNPRGYVDGQIYFLDYNFSNPDQQPFAKDVNDLISVMVYDEIPTEKASDILAKFGRIYKIMAFLTDEQKIEQIDLRNMIKMLLLKPFDDVIHMPVTRDLSESARDKIVAWIDALNHS